MLITGIRFNKISLYQSTKAWTYDKE